jgi:putative ABC transport system permease protein
MRRLRAYAGLWALVGLLSSTMVFLAAGAGPTIRDIEDRALREMLDDAPMPVRDVLATEPGEASAADAEQFRDDVTRLLEPELAASIGDAWGIQRTRLYRPTATSAGAISTLVGEGLATGLDGYFPAAALHYQTDLPPELTVVDGAAPATDRGTVPSQRVIEVMTSVEIADALAMRVGETYRLLPGVAVWGQKVDEAADLTAVPVRLTGLFEPRDASAAVWEFDPRLLTAAEFAWPAGDGELLIFRATLITDEAGIDTLFGRGLVGGGQAPTLRSTFDLENVARLRLDERRIDADWTERGRAAVGALLTDPRRRSFMRIDTGLTGLLEDFDRQASATRAVVAVVAAGLIGTAAGLLILAAQLALDRRRSEVTLLRARGASTAGLAGRFLTEAAVVVVPAAVVGWLAHRLLPGRPDPDLLPGVGAIPLVVTVAALLAVPVTVSMNRIVAERRGGPPAGGGGRRELRGFRSAPVRLTAEVLVVLLAGLGVWLLRQRGVNQAGIDPYLSAVPILVAVAAGLLALRFYPWPLRLFGAAAARRRGVVGFLGFARAGRAAPVTALPLVVLVLAVGLGGFAGAVYASVSAARDTAALRAVGADLRVDGEALTDESAAAVADVPGVAAVASLRRDGRVYDSDGGRVQAVVLTVDASAYQEVLVALGTAERLPEPVVSATSGAEPVPVLAGASIIEETGTELTLQVGANEFAAQVVGDVEELPRLIDGERWILVPRHALAEPVGIDEFLVAGAGADPDAVRAATGDDPDAVTLTSRTGYRADLDASEFNRGLTLALVVGTAGAALGGLLAVGMALLVQGAVRGRSLSVLRTMGLSPRQARGLLLVELVPVTLLAVAAGAVAGALLPVLLAPSLGLARFTDGVPIPVGLDVRTAGLLAALLGVFVIGGAIAEAAVNRRLGLGQVLRVD